MKFGLDSQETHTNARLSLCALDTVQCTMEESVMATKIAEDVEEA